ncbi:MAG: hypothetical protein ACJAYE_001110 [Candidatus Azotimanducaceae bacterium]|jgi:hypothetical protein
MDLAIDLAIAETASIKHHEPLLKITTQSRYSGKAQFHLLPYRLQDNQYLVGATNQRNNIKPDWYLNLKEEPIVQIEIADASFYAKAITPVGNERLRVTAIIKDMIQFPDRVPRETAAVILQPLC